MGPDDEKRYTIGYGVLTPTDFKLMFFTRSLALEQKGMFHLEIRIRGTHQFFN
jgi:hypothetical protein